MKTKNKNKINLINTQSSFDKSLYYARWIALYEAINMIAEEAEQRKKKFENIKLSPVKIKKYISSVEDQIQRCLIGKDLNAKSI
jgi:7-keto-8-aminopelargonate synthetase-like enzyme